MKILITGATGYAGSYVADYLKKGGYEIRLSAREIPSFMRNWAEGFEVALGDIMDIDFCLRVSEGIDVICHFAALNEVECENSAEASLMVNSLGTFNLLSGASKNKIKRFYYMSTFHVYGFPDSNAITEDTLPSPVSHYAISHYAAERYCHQFFLKNALYYNILRISNGYGAPLFKEIDRWSLVLNDFCKSAATKAELILKTKGAQKRDFVSLNDISRALQLLIDNPQTEYKLFNIGGENSKSIRELADMVIGICKKDFNRDIKLKFADHLLDSPVQKNISFDISRIRAMGFSPQADMEEEIRRLIKMCHEFKTN